jgi:23S rRNA pseudouridine2457 synthase
MFRYLVFYKPYGVMSTFTDPDGRPTLSRYIPISRVYAAGRLDFKSEGLLLVTNDGGLIHRLTDPCFEHPKTYWAQVEGEANPGAVERLTRGVTIRVPKKTGAKTRRESATFKALSARLIPPPAAPPRPTPVRAYHPTAWIELVLTEGKKHQVRQMTAAIGYPTLRLLRVAIGSLTLDGLLPGQWRELTPQEYRDLLKSR